MYKQKKLLNQNGYHLYQYQSLIIERYFYDLSRYLVFISLLICFGTELGTDIRSALDIPKFIVHVCALYNLQVLSHFHGFQMTAPFDFM